MMVNELVIVGTGIIAITTYTQDSKSRRRCDSRPFQSPLLCSRTEVRFRCSPRQEFAGMTHPEVGSRWEVVAVVPALN